MNVAALVATLVFAAVLSSVFAFLYREAVKAHRAGELALDGIRILRVALLGQLLLYAVLGVTAFLT